MGDNLQIIYSNILNGLNNNNYHDLVNIVKRICNLIPEFSLLGARTIENYSQKELEDIVTKFIKKVQKLQINKAQNALEWGVGVGNQGITNNTVINLQKKAQAQQNWDSIFKNYYDLNKNNLKNAIEYLNNGEATQSQVEKIENTLYALDLYQYIIFNQTKNRFEFILDPDLKSGGQYARKLTLPLFKHLIMAKLPNSTADGGQNILKLTNQNEIAEVQRLKKLVGARQLHPNVRQTDEYKFFCKMIEKFNLERKYKKVDRFIKKSINQKTKQGTSKIVDKLFNKFKSFGNRNIKNSSLQSQIDANLFKNLNTKAQDVFLPLQMKYNNVKVLDKGSEIEKLVKLKQQKNQSMGLLKQLSYIPQSEDPSQDIVKTAQVNIPAITRKTQKQNQLAQILQLTVGRDQGDLLGKRVKKPLTIEQDYSNYFQQDVKPPNMDNGKQTTGEKIYQAASDVGAAGVGAVGSIIGKAAERAGLLYSELSAPAQKVVTEAGLQYINQKIGSKFDPDTITSAVNVLTGLFGKAPSPEILEEYIKRQQNQRQRTIQN